MHRILKIQLGVISALILLMSFGGQIQSQPSRTVVWEVREIGADSAGLRAPFALAYVPGRQTLFAAPVKQPGAEGDTVPVIVSFNFYGDEVGTIPGQTLPADPVNVAYDPGSGSLFFLRHAQTALNVMRLTIVGSAHSAELESVNIDDLGVEDVQGLAFDANKGQLFILDGGAGQIVRIVIDGEATDPQQAFRNARVSSIELDDMDAAGLRGIAFNPLDGHLYVLHRESHILYKVTETGHVAARFKLSELGLRDPQGFVFAPSGDLTDDPERMSLYVADRRGDEQGRIIEIAFGEPLESAATMSTTAPLVQVIDSSGFEPPSPDTAGVAFISDEDRLVMSDSEVNEMPIYDDANVFISTPQGNLQRVFNTLGFSREPTGVAYAPNGQRLFFSDDSADEVFELRAGADGDFGTEDDVLTSFDTREFDSGDPEGVAYDGLENRLFIADGTNSEVYEVRAGLNGQFDGVDDEVAKFDTEDLGVRDPEGIEFNPDTGNLYVAGRPDEIVLEVTTAGEVVQFIDISEAEPRKSAGLAYARRSNDPAYMSLYVAERGVDNDSDPGENDGKVYELGLDIAAHPATPTPTATITPTPMKTPTATPTVTTPTPNPNPTVEIRDEFMLFVAYFSGGSGSQRGQE